MTSRIRIGTRGSRLALAQAGWVQAAVQRRQPGLTVELVTIKTSGDRFLDRPLRSVGGKGLFVKEIEEALAAGEIDCAVHSMKDVPAELGPGLVIAAIPKREDARDVLITRQATGLDQLRPGTRLGTSSLRRTALIRALRDDLEVQNLRGNVDSRLGKLDAGEVDALVLAAAGLQRLGIDRAHVHLLDPQFFVPAIGQGALAIESRSDEIEAILADLDDASARTAVTAERAFLRRTGGSCYTPLAAHAETDGSRMTVRALIASPDGRQIVRGERSGAAVAAAAVGEALADELLKRGGAEILASLEKG